VNSNKGVGIKLRPEEVAYLFWEMSSEEQAKFFNYLDKVADFHFPFQLQAITDEHGLTLGGRRVMGSIGEYSHWGLVPHLKINPTTGAWSVE
jgi:hypothetical protein